MNNLLMRLPIILASASPARLELLKRINIFPDQVLPADIDESELKRELPAKLVSRLSIAKAHTIAEKLDQAVIIAADTVIATGRTMLPKALNAEEVKACLLALQQRRHRAYTGVCIIKKTASDLQIRKRVVQTVIQFKKLSTKEIEFYCQLNEGLNKAGGYSILGFAESFVSFISGSYSNVIGLPLFETVNMLDSVGVHPRKEETSLK